MGNKVCDVVLVVGLGEKIFSMFLRARCGQDLIGMTLLVKTKQNNNNKGKKKRERERRGSFDMSDSNRI